MLRKSKLPECVVLCMCAKIDVVYCTSAILFSQSNLTECAVFSSLVLECVNVCPPSYAALRWAGGWVNGRLPSPCETKDSLEVVDNDLCSAWFAMTVTFKP
jgi:hypothetical protein